MTFKQLQKKLEYFETSDYQDLLEELIKKHPEVKPFFEVRFGFLDENTLLSDYREKIAAEFEKKWIKNSWGSGQNYYKYKPKKAKKYLKEFGKICKDRKNLLRLMFFYFQEYCATILEKEKYYHILEPVYKSRDQLFVDICKEIKKQNGGWEFWAQELSECLKVAKKGNYFYSLEATLQEVLSLNKEDLGLG